MNEILPIKIENLDLPDDSVNKKGEVKINGFVSVIYLISLIISLGSILTIMIMGNR